MKFLKLFNELTLAKKIIFSFLLTACYYPFFDDGTTLEGQIQGAEASVVQETARSEEIKITIKKEEEMRGNIQQLVRNLEHLKSKIPSEFTETQMSTMINSISLASNIKLIEFATDASANGFTNRVGGAVAAVTSNPTEKSGAASHDLTLIKPEDLIDQIRFKVTLKGQFEDFLLFLNNLSKEDKIVRIRNFYMEKNSTDIEDDSIKLVGEIVGYKQSTAFQTKDTK